MGIGCFVRSFLFNIDNRLVVCCVLVLLFCFLFPLQQMYMEKIFGSIVATNLCGMPTHIVESAVMLNLQQQQQQQQSLEREVSQSLWSAQSRTCDFALSNGDMPFKVGGWVNCFVQSSAMSQC